MKLSGFFIMNQLVKFFNLCFFNREEGFSRPGMEGLGRHGPQIPEKRSIDSRKTVHIFLKNGPLIPEKEFLVNNIFLELPQLITRSLNQLVLSWSQQLKMFIYLVMKISSNLLAIIQIHAQIWSPCSTKSSQKIVPSVVKENHGDGRIRLNGLKMQELKLCQCVNKDGSKSSML